MCRTGHIALGFCLQTKVSNLAAAQHLDISTGLRGHHERCVSKFQCYEGVLICRHSSRQAAQDRQHGTGQHGDKTRLVQHFGYDAEDVEHTAERYLDEELPGAVQVWPQEDPRPRSVFCSYFCNNIVCMCQLVEQQYQDLAVWNPVVCSLKVCPIGNESHTCT